MRTASLLLALLALSPALPAQPSAPITVHFYGEIGYDVFNIRLNFHELGVQRGEQCDSMWYTVNGEYQIAEDTALTRVAGRLAFCQRRDDPAFGVVGKPFTVMVDRPRRRGADTLRLSLVPRDANVFLTGWIGSASRSAADTIWGYPSSPEVFARAVGRCDSSLRLERELGVVAETPPPNDAFGVLGYWIGMNTRHAQLTAARRGYRLTRHCRGYSWASWNYPNASWGRVPELILDSAAARPIRIAGVILGLSAERRVESITLTSTIRRDSVAILAELMSSYLIQRYGSPHSVAVPAAQAAEASSRSGRDELIAEWRQGMRRTRLSVWSDRFGTTRLRLTWD
jgi:hypothetical protein